MHPSLCTFTILAAAVTPLAAQVGTIETNSTKKNIVRCVQASNDGLVMAADGSYWAFVYERINTTQLGYMELRYSMDQGKTWVDKDLKVDSGKYQTSSLASMCLARNGMQIHLIWTGKSGKAGAKLYNSAYYQAFDISKKAFVGKPELIADGYSSNNQFQGHAIAETGEGHLVVAATGHRSGGLGLTGWSCGLWIKKKGATSWPTNGIKVNLSSGVQPSIDVEGEKVHLTMRDTTGGYGPIYRRYDVKAGKFDTPVVRTWPSSQGTVVGAGNVYSFVIDDDGGKWLMWPEGVVSGNKNAALNVSYAAPGKGDKQDDWSKAEVFKDSKIKGGNSSERFYSFARAVGSNIYVVYSKPAENYNTLYYEIWSKGKRLVPKAVTLSKTTTANRFAWVTGVGRRHNGHAGTIMTWGLYSSGTTSGQVDLWRIGGRGFYTVYGSGCQGNLGNEPKVTSTGLPTQGAVNSFMWSGLPKSAALWQGVGLNAIAPVSAVSFGAPICTLDTDLALGAFAGTTTATGTYTISGTVPSTPSLLGFGVHFQLLVAASGSPGGVITTPAVAWRF